jgi:hypothetical protein
MANQVVFGALCQCTFGAAPSALNVIPKSMTNAQNIPAASVMDNIPLTNILPFGVCSSLANPTVASATSAASGVLTPMPCIPATSAPWLPGSPTTMVGGFPALNDSSKLMCSWGGVISINFAGQVTVQV